MQTRAALTAAALFSATSACNAPPAETVAPEASAPGTSILLIGDTGYDYNWLEQDDYDEKLTGREFIENELDDWIEDKLPIEEFAIPPMHLAEQTGGYVMASGMWPVSKASTSWCADAARCDFGVMLGDNIYPSGATLGADGRDDDERFRELLWEPYRGYREQDPEFVLYAVLGNHDWETSREGAMLQVDWMQRSPLYHMDGIFYSVRPTPDIELFAIDTTVMLAGETVYEDALDDSGAPVRTWVVEPEVEWATPTGAETEMLAWLERSLAASDARWKIVIGHHPVFSSSGTKAEEEIVLQQQLRPVLCRYADAYLAGHDHMLEVHTDDCSGELPDDVDAPPLLHVVSGAAGKQRPQHSNFMAWQGEAFPGLVSHYVRSLVWGFGEMVVSEDSARVLMVSTPNDGSGETQLDYEGSFERRSQHLGTVAP